MKKTLSKLFIVLISLAMIFALVGCGKKNEDASSNENSGGSASGKNNSVMSHAEYAATEKDKEVTVETYVQAKQILLDDKTTLYTQDQDGGYFIYNINCSAEDYEKLIEGQKIRVNGYKGEWSGEEEVVDGILEIIEGNWIAESEDVTSILGSDKLIEHKNEKVSFFGMTVEPKKDEDGNEVAFFYNWDGSGTRGDDLYFDVSKDGNTYTFTVESYLCGEESDVYKAVEKLKVGDIIDMEGFLYWYEGVNPHITSIK